MNRQKPLPSHCLTVTKYNELRGLLTAFADGAYEMVCVLGGPGLGKSEMIRRIMQQAAGPNGWGLIKGKHTPLDLYERFHRYRSVPVVLDDLDDLLRKTDNVLMLKCVCDSLPVKRVEWGSNHSAFQTELPKSFETISRVCLVSNDWNALDRNIGALHDRGVVVHFQPSAVEVHRELAGAGWFEDEEVFDFVGRHLYLISEPSFRFYKTAAAHKRAGLDWRDLTLRSIESAADPKLLLVAKLLVDDRHDLTPSPEQSRVQAFGKLGGGSKATYHRYKKELLTRRGEIRPADVDGIKLRPPTPDLHYTALLDRRDQIAQLGKIPNEDIVLAATNVDTAVSASDRIDELLERLQRATVAGDAEETARLRDEIRRLLGEKSDSDD